MAVTLDIDLYVYGNTSEHIVVFGNKLMVISK